MAPASVMKRFKANGASQMSDFHRVSPEMAWLRLCRITNESIESENLLLQFKQRVALPVELSISQQHFILN